MFDSIKNLRLNVKISILGAGSVLVAAAILVVLAVWQSGQYNRLAQKEVDDLLAADLDHITQSVYNLVQTENEAVQIQVDSNLNVARLVLTHAGGIQFSSETVHWKATNQFTSETIEIDLPKMLIGGQWLGQNTDLNVKTLVVDEVRNLIGETATIFQRMNEKGDMLRVATTIAADDNRRAIGAYIPAVNPDGTPNPVIAAILEGNSYHGRAYVVNAWYLTAYEPIKNGNGDLVGMLYVGVKQKNLEARIRHAILQTKVGETGYVYVIGGQGEHQGHYIISQRGERDGENIWENQDSDGRYVIQAIVKKALALRPGELDTERYRWQNPGETTPRWKIARLAYYAPWDWVIGTSVYEDELQTYRTVLSNGRIRMTRIMSFAGLASAFLLGLIGVFIAWTIARPIRQMTEAANTITQGNLDQRVEIDSRDEIGALADAFNLMTLRLKQTLEGLRESEKNYRLIFENAIEGLFQTSMDGRFIRANAAMARLLKFESPTELTEQVSDIRRQIYVHPEDRDRLISGLLEQDAVVDREIQYYQKDRQIIWISISARLTRDNEGQPQYIEGFITDITKRRQAEEALLQSEKYFRQLIEDSPIANIVYYTDQETNLLINKKFENLFGYTLQDIPDVRSWWPLAYPDENYRAQVIHEWGLRTKRAIENQTFLEPMEVYVRCKNGETRQVEIHLSNIGDKNLVTFIDLTERKRTEEALRKNENYLRQLVENSPVAMAVVQIADDKVLLLNRTFTELLGYTLSDIPDSNSWWSRAYPDRGYREYILKQWHELVERAGRDEAESAPVEILITCKNGSIRCVYGYLSMIGEQYLITFVDITDRKQAEKDLQTVHKRLEDIIEFLPDATFVIDAEKKVIAWNRALEEMTGVQKEEIIGQGDYAYAAPFFGERRPIAIDLIGVNDPQTEARYDFVERRGQTLHTEVYVPSLYSGRGAYVSVMASPLLDSEGRRYGAIESIHDITERKQAEEALHKSEQDIRQLIENSPVAMLVSRGVEENVLLINRKFIELFGYTREDIPDIAHWWPLAYPNPEYREKVMKEWAARVEQAVRNRTEITPLEILIACKNGTVRHIEGHLSSIGDRNLATFIDLTERKQAEIELRKVNQTLQAIIDACPLAILSLDPEGRVISWSPAAERIFGWRQEEIIGQFNPIIPEDKKAEFKGFYTQVISGTAYTNEVQRRKKDGALIHVSVSTAPLRDPQGEIIGALGIIEDITERKSLEEQLLQSQKMEAIGKLAGGIAHDFNNLLTVINGYSDLALKKMNAADSFYRTMEEIKKAGERAASLTRQLLAYSRKQVLQPKILNINELLINMDKMLRRLIGENIELVIFPSPNLRSVKADPSQIEQVIMNLVLNSSDAMPNGGCLTIETSNVDFNESSIHTHGEAQTGSYIMLAVSDNGCGMSKETLKQVFDPFFTTKEKGKGTGLGLPTVYGIVKQSGGFVTVYSELGKGATFKIYLPQSEEEQTIENRLRDGIHLGDEALHGTETILVVEDEEMVRRMVSHLLEEHGYTVLQAGYCSEALQVSGLHTGTIHLLLTDVILPEKSGREVADSLLSVRPGIKILYMSGYTEKAIVHHGVMEDGILFIQKPFSPHGLLRKIREIFDAPPSNSIS